MRDAFTWAIIGFMLYNPKRGLLSVNPCKWVFQDLRVGLTELMYHPRSFHKQTNLTN